MGELPVIALNADLALINFLRIIPGVLPYRPEKITSLRLSGRKVLSHLDIRWTCARRPSFVGVVEASFSVAYR